mmetsp:Transcript_131104/g.293289  ORF Transcript_131104/g.293289 Transcript_131104/m.293289 type:complete len:266 (-) Transcript_131104:87-884(-)
MLTHQELIPQDILLHAKAHFLADRNQIPGYLFSIHPDIALCRFGDPRHHADGRTLSSAIVPQEAEALPLVHCEVEVVDSWDSDPGPVGVVFPQAPHRDDLVLASEGLQVLTVLLLEVLSVLVLDLGGGASADFDTVPAEGFRPVTVLEHEVEGLRRAYVMLHDLIEVHVKKPPQKEGRNEHEHSAAYAVEALTHVGNGAPGAAVKVVQVEIRLQAEAEADAGNEAHSEERASTEVGEGREEWTLSPIRRGDPLAKVPYDTDVKEV